MNRKLRDLLYPFLRIRARIRSRKFDHVVTFGYNCELSARFFQRFKFVDSTLFSWASSIEPDRMAHAIERDPEQAAAYRELHEAHKRNPEGYKKLYPNFFGFLVATFRKELESVDIPEKSEVQDAPEKQEIPECVQGIRLCVPRTQRLPLHRINRRTFRPFVRLPMTA